MVNQEYTYAVIGASRDPNKYGNKVFNDLLNSDFNVVPINIHGGELYGEKVYETISDYPDNIDVAIIVVPPDIALDILDELEIVGITKVWLQPGSESKDVIAKCEELGITYTANACIMVQRQSTEE